MNFWHSEVDCLHTVLPNRAGSSWKINRQQKVFLHLGHPLTYGLCRSSLPAQNLRGMLPPAGFLRVPCHLICVSLWVLRSKGLKKKKKRSKVFSVCLLALVFLPLWIASLESCSLCHWGVCPSVVVLFHLVGGIVFKNTSLVLGNQSSVPLSDGIRLWCRPRKSSCLWPLYALWSFDMRN